MFSSIKTIKFSNYFLSILIIICEISSSEVPRPRGVSLSRASLYDASKDFTCFDNSLTIPFTQVNDDYCDCLDASDEPGTAACPNGLFHCTNAGHRPLNIVSSRVNDGICDCCDASDEYLTNKCINNCKELGKSAREEAQRQLQLLKVGKQIHAELSEKGIKLKQEKKEKLTELQRLKQEADALVKEKEAHKKEVEELEKNALDKHKNLEDEQRRIQQIALDAKNKAEAVQQFNKFDSNNDGYLDIAELKVRHTFDKDHNGEVSDEEARYFLQEKDKVNEEEFIDYAWPLMKPFIMREAGLFTQPADNTDEPSDIHSTDASQTDEHADKEKDESTTHHDKYSTTDEQDEQQYEEDKTTHLDEEDEDDEYEENGDGAKTETGLETDEQQPKQEEEQEATVKIPYDEETKELIEQADKARQNFDEADRNARDIQSEIQKIEEYMNKDFGPNEAFAPLEGNCFEYTDYEYIYKLCPFDMAVQKPKSGGIETRLGEWGKWNGIGSSNFDLYSNQLYERGQSCWNGPQRFTNVKITCGSEDKLTGVSEPNRCEYLFNFQTPAACIHIPEDNTDDLHDEL